MEIKFLSDEYFKLINEDAQLKEYFEVAVKVIVKHGGKVYKVTE